MKLRTTAILLLLAFQANAQILVDFVRYEQMLANGQCNELLKEAREIRNSEQYGKNPIIDYYMSRSYCCLGKPEVANYAYDFIEKNYSKDNKLMDIIDNARQSCNRPATNTVSVSENLLNRLVVALLSEDGNYSVLRGKGGFIIDCNDLVAAYELDPSFDREEMNNRLFEIDEAPQAKAYYESFLDTDKYNVVVMGRFILITPGTKDEPLQRYVAAAEELEKVYDFFSDYYNIRAPEKLIAVYLMGNTKNLQEVALKTHGIHLPKENLGYSNLSDLSVLGNSTKNGIGTIKHELFHLMIRTDLGDIPGWMDEGIASVYEESYWKGDVLMHIKKMWRTEALRFYGRKGIPIPRLEKLIRNNWSEFNPGTIGVSACDVGLNYAVAKHFMIYLEEQSKLRELVTAFKNRPTIFDDENQTEDDHVKIVEQVLGEPISDTQNKYDEWLEKQYGISSVHD